MITRVSSVGIRAGDQGRAVDFYVGKLGFEKRRDDPMGTDGRWVEFTELPADQPWGRWAQFRDPDGNEHALIEHPGR
jgi:predicted enzyme related to lactoylglutathione lyase